MNEQSVPSNDENRSLLDQRIEVANILLGFLNAPPVNGDRQPRNEIPLSQARTEIPINANNKENRVIATATTTPASPDPIVEDGERDERQISTPDPDSWSLGSPPYVDSDDFDADTVYSPPYAGHEDFDADTVSDVLRQGFNRENRLDRREQQVKKKEFELGIREKALNTGNENALKRKVDEWLVKPREQRGVIIDHEIIGFAMNQHPYLWMNPEDRRRVNCTRYELEKVEEIAERNATGEYCCPICFDSINTNRPFAVPECGHTHCHDCIKKMDSIVGSGKNAHCGKCLKEIKMSEVRRIFFASRE